MTLRDNCCVPRSRGASHFLTFAELGSKVPGLTWKRFFLESPSLSPREASSPFLQSDDLFHSTPRQFMSTVKPPAQYCHVHFPCRLFIYDGVPPQGQVVYFVHVARWQTPLLAGSIPGTRFSGTLSAVEQLSFLPVMTFSIVEGVHGPKHFPDVGHRQRCIRFGTEISYLRLPDMAMFLITYLGN